MGYLGPQELAVQEYLQAWVGVAAQMRTDSEKKGRRTKDDRAGDS